MDMIQYLESAASGTSQRIPWPLVQGLCEKLSYGGRIDNEQDFTRLECLIREFIDEKIMTSRWQPMFLNITVPNSSHVEDYVKAFDQLPDTDSPTLYGIPASTNASRDLIFCRNTLKVLRSQYFSSGTVQNFEKRLRPIVGLWHKLSATASSSSSPSSPTIVRLDSLIERSRDSTEPWTIFIASELTVARNLHATIDDNFQALKVALKDAGLLNAKDRSLLTTICDNLVPVQWRRIWSGPKTVIEYLRAVTWKTQHAERMFSSLLERQSIEQVDFNHLFNVQAMLTALKLCRSKQRAISTTELTLCATFGVGGGAAKKGGIMVAPLLIDGGTLKQTKLAIQLSTTDVNTTGQFELNYEAREGTTATKATRDDVLPVPLYNNISRDVLLCTIAMDVAPGLSKTALISAGIALIIPESYQ
uniref:Dynein heavy chain C-terminal domain-containing protein n=1 Tax=Anopheles atroparvus TaxID=41427 RepID=A0AAG5DJT2_ANOAO